MKKLIALLAVVLAVSAFAPVADAGQYQRRLFGYNYCGTPIYDTVRCVGYNSCGAPIYGWVRDRYPAGCTRPGHCNYHRRVHAQTRVRTARIQSPSVRQSQTHFVRPYAPLRSSFVRNGFQSRTIRSSHSQVRSSHSQVRSSRSQVRSSHSQARSSRGRSSSTGTRSGARGGGARR